MILFAVVILKMLCEMFFCERTRIFLGPLGSVLPSSTGVPESAPILDKIMLDLNLFSLKTNNYV